MELVYLADYPDYIPVLARWHHEQWNYLDPSRTVEQRTAWLQTHGKRTFPTAFVAVENGSTPIGCASLVSHDMSDRMDLSPWLASVYVEPPYRQRGVGSALVRRVMDEARAFAAPRLYLYTPDRESFYARIGWQVYDRRIYRGHLMVMMSIELGTPS
jgi:predicted N-acetyltransferase YhbS